MKIKDLKKNMLLSKKSDKELSKSYGAILKQVEYATIGVKNPETDESKLILSASKKELKEQLSSKKENAPYSQSVIDLSEKLIAELGPKMMTENETKVAIDAILVDFENPSMKDMGKIMGQLSKEYGENIDLGIANKLVRSTLQ